MATASVRLEQVRITAQSEFCAGDLGSLALAGDETGFRLPGDPGFIQASAGPDPTSGGRALQSYPEPQWSGGGPCPAPAPWDGRLELATLALAPSPVAEPGLTFLAGWEKGYDADYGAGSTACTLDRCHGPPSASLLASASPGADAVTNMIYPDGCYSETRHTPGYEAKDNLGDGVSGMISFWFKPSLPPDYGPKPVNSLGRRNFSLLSIFAMDINPLITPAASMFPYTQVIQFGGRRTGQGRMHVGMVLEKTANMSDTQMEQGPLWGWYWDTDPAPLTFWQAHRWHLMVFQWNANATARADFSTMYLDNVCNTATLRQYYSGDDLANGVPPLPFTRDSWREDGTFGRTLFHLGVRGVNLFLLVGKVCAADGTYDEFAAHTRGTDMTEASLLSGTRFEAGRYVKEDAGADPALPAYCSAEIRLPPGTALLRADWTLVMPRVIRRPAPALAPDFLPPPNQIAYGTGDDMVAGDTADARLHLLDAAGTPLRDPVAGRSGARLDLKPAGGVFRFGIDLRPRLGDNTGTWSKLTAPLLESPALDDVTFTCLPPGGPVVQAWSLSEVDG